MIFSCQPAPPQAFWIEVNRMTWTTPTFVEISLCCEINSYASAKL
jgi:coenzyme PQQ precursor peptide PqqA